jgi:signal transduction histidine kinase
VVEPATDRVLSSKRVTRRLVLTIASLVLASAVVQSAVTIRWLVHSSAVTVLNAFEPLTDATLDACEADPVHWRLGAARWEAWAYDAETGRSMNPDAPVASAWAPWLVRSWGGQSGRLYRDGPWGGTLAQLTGRPGPCSFVLVRWDRAAEPRAGAATALLVSLGLLFAIGVGLAARWVVQPLMRDVDETARAAARVGRPGFQLRARPGVLEAVRAVLRDAHQRLLDQAEAESRRRMRIERHFAEIAHDLRTPMAALQLRLEALAARDPEANGAIGDLLFVQTLLENLQFAARMRESAASASPRSELGAIVDRVGDRFVLIGRRAEVEVVSARPDEAVEVEAEAAHVEQLVTNLVHNAVRHHRPGGHVAIELGTEAGRFWLEVADDGAGDAAAIQARLEAASLELPAGGAAEGGGLGLAIVGAIVRGAGWSARATAAPEGGVVVRVEGPVAAPLHRGSTSAGEGACGG